jgi:hypothetical protein
VGAGHSQFVHCEAFILHRGTPVYRTLHAAVILLRMDKSALSVFGSLSRGLRGSASRSTW